MPVVGDWDNNGTANVGVVRNENGFLMWDMDVTGDHIPEVSRVFGLAGDQPMVGDWNDDGRIDLGVARQIPGTQSYQILLDTDGNPEVDRPITTINAPVNSRFITGRFALAEVRVHEAGQTPSGTAASTSDIQDGATQPVSYGTVLVGSASPSRTFVITNTGNVPLMLGNITVPNGFELDNVVPNVVNPQNSVQIGVRLKTNTVGAFADDIRFTSNDGNETPFNFAIAGVVESLRPQISVTGSTAFGTTLLGTSGESIERSFRIENPGNSPMSFSSSVSNQEFTVISGASGVVPKGGFQTLVVRMNTTTAGAKSAKLTFTSNAVNTPTLRLTLSGEVQPHRPQITVDGSGTFGTVALGADDETTFRSFTVRNTGNSVLNYTAMVNSAGFSIVLGASGSIQPNTQAIVTIRIKTSSVATYAGVLTLKSNSVISPTHKQSLSGEVVSLPKITVSGDGVFGKVDRLVVQERQITIRNMGTAALNYDTVLSNASFTIVSGQQGTVAPNGGIVTLVVRVNSSTSGSLSGELRITSNDTRRPTVVQNLSATVVEPVAEVTAGGVVLSAGQIGLMNFEASSSIVRTQSFKVRNTGTGALRISGIQIAGNAFSHNMPASFEIPSGGFREFNVTMQDSSPGTKVGRLTFTTSDTDEAQIRINLLGRMLEPVRFIQGLVNRNLINGVFHYYPTNQQTIFIDPSWGNTTYNGVYAISNAGTKDTFSGELRTVIIYSVRRPDVQNWTNVNIVWNDGTRQQSLPPARNRLDLFAGF